MISESFLFFLQWSFQGYHVFNYHPMVRDDIVK